uniref:AlNc14C373G11130 protein n=1 Tax=Albugo laibachii Nc14 TaxID=890382 RepID=F0WY70_9STRA|nr:AlNc14C373G11130 [Albugo laibachii Nc14]|eukprot:CCA26422.1 AlNc14C373G11130 [Albugo laibachii Nc14]
MAETYQLSEFFPRVTKECTKVANEFFDCFYTNGKQEKGVEDSDIGNRALQICEKSLRKYNQCIDQSASRREKALTRAPEAYRVRE